MKIKKITLLLILFLIFSIIGFVTLGEPSLTGDIHIQTYSDSLTYEEIAKNHLDETSIFSVASNVIGAAYVIKFLDYNYLLIFIMNIFIFIFSLILILHYYDLKWKVFSFFIFGNTLIYFSLFNINKEIFVLLDIALFVVFLKNKKTWLYLVILLIAFFIRWQFAFFFLLLPIFLFIDKHYKQRWVIFFLLVISLSVVYPYATSAFSNVVQNGKITDTDLVKGSGILPMLNNIQEHLGGYVFSFIPKLLQLNIGLVKRINMLGYPDDFWNYFVLLLHNLMNLILIIYMIYKKKFTFKNRLIYIAMIYGAIFAVTPIANVRYFFPMYLLMLIVVSQKNHHNDIKENY